MQLVILQQNDSYYESHKVVSFSTRDSKVSICYRYEKLA